MRTRIPMGWADLIVAVVLVLLIGAVGISAVTDSRELANRYRCASNLRQIGLAILLYQNDNMQSPPRTVADNADDPKPVWGTPYQANPKLGPGVTTNPFDGGNTAPAANDVTASLYLLMRTEQIASPCFICPSANLRPWDFGGNAENALNWNNWDGNSGLRRHLSYSFQNPFASKAAVQNGFQLKNPDATFALAADMNPGGDAVTTVTLKSSPDEMKNANSLNHNRDGQNVLYGDGHVEVQSTPFAGTNHDNIYTAGGPEIKADERNKAVIAASSVSPSDSILLPTSADIGFKPAPTDSKPLTAGQRDKLKSDIQGKYVAMINGVESPMTVDDKSIKYTVNNLTVEYDYEVIGGSGNTLVVKLVNPDKSKHTRATIELDDGELQITTISSNIDLDYSWKRVNDTTPGK
jgi:prepilin-type processing-associated H-X9-DG protein